MHLLVHHHIPRLLRLKCSHHYSAARDTVKFRVERLEGFGRSIIANQTISKGEIVLKEEAYVSILRTDRNSRCWQCWTPSSSKFCSKCREKAMSTTFNFLLSDKRNYKEFYDQVVTEERVYPIMASHIIARVFSSLVQTRKLEDPTSQLISSTLEKDGLLEQRWLDDYTLLKDKILTEPGQSQIFTLDYYATSITRLNLNCFKIPDPRGTALFLQTAMINHACSPNTEISFEFIPGHQPFIQIRALENISQGQQVFLSYLDLDQYPGKDVRKEQLYQSYGFKCTCPLCS